MPLNNNNMMGIYYSFAIIFTCALLQVMTSVDSFQVESPLWGKNQRGSFIKQSVVRKDFHDASSSSRYSQLYMSSRGVQPSPEKMEFAYQEMRAQLNAMKNAGIQPRDLTPEKRAELTDYVRAVALGPYEKGLPLSEIGPNLLPQSKWRLSFSTESATLGDLPNDATVILEFLDESNVDYTLQFSKKTLGLDSITAKSKYTIDAGPIQPGLVTFVYDKIVTNMMGMKNLGVGFFGLLKGRANYVESIYFDGIFWIERGIAPDGITDFFNVYMLDEE